MKNITFAQLLPFLQAVLPAFFVLLATIVVAGWLVPKATEATRERDRENERRKAHIDIYKSLYAEKLKAAVAVSESSSNLISRLTEVERGRKGLEDKLKRENLNWQHDISLHQNTRNAFAAITEQQEITTHEIKMLRRKIDQGTTADELDVELTALERRLKVFPTLHDEIEEYWKSLEAYQTAGDGLEAFARGHRWLLRDTVCNEVDKLLRCSHKLLLGHSDGQIDSIWTVMGSLSDALRVAVHQNEYEVLAQVNAEPKKKGTFKN